MYPPQTSLIPATVALVKFFEARGFSAFFQNYPYWYLGSTPFKFLIGPVIPVLEVALKSLLPISLFSISIVLVVFFAILGGMGWVLLIKKIFQSEDVSFGRSFYLGIFAIYVILPWKYLSGLGLDEVSSFAAKSLLPFTLLVIWFYLNKKSVRNLSLSVLAITFIFLVNTNIFVSLLTGTLALSMASALETGRIKKWQKHVKSLALLFVLSIIVSTLWYGPAFWWVQLANPGIGGGNVVKVALSLLDFVRGIVPLVLAIIAVYFRSKFKNKVTVFVWIFFGAFTALSIFRFMANPEFWMDWSSWLYEMEVGLWLLVVIFLTGNKYLQVFLTVFTSFAITLYIYNLLGSPVLISPKPPDIVNSLPKLVTLAGDNRVFVTGSSVFWLNSYYDTVQVRGGRDEVALDPNWRTAAYTFRESQSADKIMASIEKVGVTYVLVNSDSSPDFYKDFKNLSVWPTIATLEASEAGDYIYFIYNTY